MNFFRIEGVPDNLPDGTYPSRLRETSNNEPFGIIIEYAPDKTLRDSLLPIVVKRQHGESDQSA